MIRLLPAAIPVTNPALFIVATDVVADDHGVTAAAVGEPVKEIVLPTHTADGPPIVGNAFTVIVPLNDTSVQLLPVVVTV